MKNLKFTLSALVFGCLLFFSSKTIQSQPIPCTAQSYLVQKIGNNSCLYGVDLATGVMTSIKENIIPPSVGGINGIGYYNGYLWGSITHSNAVGTSNAAAIAKVDAGGNVTTWTYQEVGLPVNSNTNIGFNVGDVGPDGVLYLFSYGGSQIYKVNVSGETPVYMAPPIAISGGNFNTEGGIISDWAYNQEDECLYTVSRGVNPVLYKIDAATGACTRIGTLSAPAGYSFTNSNPSTSFGGMYLDSRGTLYMADNNTGNIYRIPDVGNLSTNYKPIFTSKANPTNGNDGALCPSACVTNIIRETIILSQGQSSITLTGGTMATPNEWKYVSGSGPSEPTIASPYNTDVTTASGLTSEGVYIFKRVNPSGNCMDSAIAIVSFLPLPLPITINTFSGKLQQEKDVLQWVTSQEQNSSYFEIQYSSTGLDFSGIGRVEASGNSNINKTYSFTTDHIGNNAYYRLKLVDINGESKYSNIIHISRTLSSNCVKLNGVAPVPFTDVLRFNVENCKTQNANVMIFNTMGQIMKQQSFLLQNGTATYMLNGLEAFPNGTYILKIVTADGNVVTQKVMK